MRFKAFLGETLFVGEGIIARAQDGHQLQALAW